MADSEFLESADDLTLPQAPGALVIREAPEEPMEILADDNTLHQEALKYTEMLDDVHHLQEEEVMEQRTKQNQECLEELRKNYPHINFDSTILSSPEIGEDGKVIYKFVYDEKGEVELDKDGSPIRELTCIHKRLYELTDEEKEKIRQMDLGFFFHGVGASGKNLEEEATMVCTERLKRLIPRYSPTICLDWYGNGVRIKACKQAARELAAYLCKEIKVQKLYFAELYGCSMGNLSMKAFVEAALAEGICLQNANVYYSKIALLHPKSLAFSKEDRDKIGFVGVDYMVPFRYKDKPFTIGFDIVHLMRYTKDFIKRQAKLLGYDDRYIAILSGKNMVEPVNMHYYQIEKIIEKSFDTSKAEKLVKKHPGFIEELRGKGDGKYTEFLRAWDKRSSQTASSSITR